MGAQGLLVDAFTGLWALMEQGPPGDESVQLGCCQVGPFLVHLFLGPSVACAYQIHRAVSVHP